MITRHSRATSHNVRHPAQYPARARAAACTLVILAFGGACTPRPTDDLSGVGRIEFADGSSLEFDEILELAFQPEVPAEADSVELSRWPLEYSPATPARSIPLAWVATLDVVEYQADAECQCMRDVIIHVRTANGVEFRTQVRTLEWISIRAAGDRDSGGESRQVYFADADGMHVRKVVLE